MTAQSGYDRAQESAGNFGKYQFYLFLVAQLFYLTVTGSMLCTTLDTAVPKVNCTNTADNLLENVTESYSVDFHSLILEWEMVCIADSYIPTFLSTAVMAGGVIGAVICGFLADRIGRKPVLIGTMCGVAALNGLIAIVGGISWSFTSVLLFLLGASGGGYMVTNLVIALESVGTQHWRLFVVAFNGWPYGLMFMALIGQLTQHWRWYHTSLAILSVIFVIPALFAMESSRWLYQHNEVEAADKILAKIARINGREALSLKNAENSSNPSSPRSLTSFKQRTNRSYSYFDLTKHKSIYIPLMALFYSWLASSVVSFGIYFNLAQLPGNRFLKLFLTGLFKAITGAIPFFLSRILGRRPIFLVSVSITCLACWSAVVIYSMGDVTWLVTVFSVLGTAAVDPIWKINHLYSTELFPTVVRNMSRAVCNIGSRLGSLVAPSVIFLRVYGSSVPYMVFGCMTLIQLVIGSLCLPETKDRALPDSLPDDNQEIEEVPEVDRTIQMIQS